MFYQDIYSANVIFRNGAFPNATTVSSQATSAQTISWPANSPSAGQVLRSADAAGSLQWATALAAGDSILVADGTAAAPGISFVSDPDTGIFRVSENIFALSTGGIERLRVTNDGTMIVAGDVIISGTTTTINTETLTVDDPLISLANNNDDADILDIGIYGKYDPTGAQDLYCGLFRDASDGKFKLFKDLQEQPTTTVNTAGLGFANAELMLSAIHAANTTNQMIFGTGNTTTVSVAAPAADRVYTLADAGADADFVMSEGAQTINGAKTFSDLIASDLVAETLSATDVANQIVLGTGNTTTMNSAVPAADRVYTLADAGADADFVMSEGAQTINGAKTFSSLIASDLVAETLSATDVANQIVLGTGNTATVSAAAPAASRVYTLADAGADANFVMSEGAQTVNGAKTFSDFTVSTEIAFGADLWNFVVGGGDNLSIFDTADNEYMRFIQNGLVIFQRNLKLEGDTLIIGNGTVDTPRVIFENSSSVPAFQIAVDEAGSIMDFQDEANATIFRLSHGASTGASVADVLLVGDLGATAASALLELRSTTHGLLLPRMTEAQRDLIAAIAGLQVYNTTAGEVQYYDGASWSSAGVVDDIVTGSVTATDATDQLVLGTGNTTTVSAPAPAASRVYTLADAGADASFVMSEGAQTINGTKTFATSVEIAGTGLLTDIIDELTLNAGVTIDGVLNKDQTVTAVSINATSAVNQLALGAGNTTTVSAPAPAASRVYTLADAGADATFVMSEGAQTINGAKTFATSVGVTGTVTATGIVTNLVSENTPGNGVLVDSVLLKDGAVQASSAALTGVANQLVLGTGNTTTLDSVPPSADRTYTLGDAGADASFVMSEGSQVINGVKTFTGLAADTISEATATTGVTVDGVFHKDSNMTAGIVVATSGAFVLGAGPGPTTIIGAPAPSATRIYTVVDAGANAAFVMTEGSQVLAGATTFASLVTANSGIATDTISEATNTIGVTVDGVLLKDSNVTASLVSATSRVMAYGEGGSTVLVQASASAAIRVYSISDVGANASFMMTEGAQAISGIKTFDDNIVVNDTVRTDNIDESTPGEGVMIDGVLVRDETIRTGSGTSVSPALQITNTSNAQLSGFWYDTVDQTINTLVIGTSGGPSFSFTGTFCEWFDAPKNGTQVLRLGDTYATSVELAQSGISTVVRGDLTIDEGLSVGSITSETLVATSLTNQIRLGDVTKVTINSVAPASNSTYTIADVGASAQFVMTEGAQTINGAKTFTAITVTGLLTDTVDELTPSAGVTVAGVLNKNQIVTARGINATSVVNQLALGTGNTTTVSAPAPAASRVYTLADAGANASFVMSEGAQTINGEKTFTDFSATAVIVDSIEVYDPTDQIVIGSGNTIALNAVDPAANRRYTLSDVGADASFVMSEGAQTINGEKTFTDFSATAAIVDSIEVYDPTDQIVIGSGNTIALNAVDPAANRRYTLSDVGADADFVMTEGAQTINGAKTFTAITVTGLLADTINELTLNAGVTIDGVLNKNQIVTARGINVTSVVNQLAFGTGNTTTVSSPAPAASRTYTLADAGADASFVMTEGAQTLNGTKTFATSVEVAGTGLLTDNIDELTLNAGVTIDGVLNKNQIVTAQSINATGVVNQLALGTGNTTTVSAAAPAASRVYTLADAGADANFVMSEGAQTINGAKTFTDFTVSTEIAFGADLWNFVVGGGDNLSIFDTADNEYMRFIQNGIVIFPRDVKLEGTTLTISNGSVDTPRIVFEDSANNPAFQIVVDEATSNMDFQDEANATVFRMSHGASTGASVADDFLVGALGATAASAQLEIRSTTKGLLLPRMTEAQRDLIAAVAGLQVYNTTASEVQYYTGAAWSAAGVIGDVTTGSITATDVINQIVLGIGNTTTVSAIAPAADRVYTLADAGADASFVMSEGAQTISGIKTLADDTIATKIIFDGGNPATDVHLVGSNQRLLMEDRTTGAPLFAIGATTTVYRNDTTPTGVGRSSLRSRGTFAVPTAMILNDFVTDNTSFGHDGVSYGFAARAAVICDETWSAGNHGTRMEFRTSDIGTAVGIPPLKLLLDSNGATAADVTVTNELSVTGDFKYQESHFECYTRNNVLSSSPAINTPTLLPLSAGTTFDNFSQGFTVDTIVNVGRVTYTGTRDRILMGNVSLSVGAVSLNNRKFICYVYKNGARLDQSETQMNFQRSSRFYNIYMQFTELCTNGDFFEVWFEVPQTANVTARYCNISGRTLPNI